MGVMSSWLGGLVAGVRTWLPPVRFRSGQAVAEPPRNVNDAAWLVQSCRCGRRLAMPVR